MQQTTSGPFRRITNEALSDDQIGATSAWTSGATAAQKVAFTSATVGHVYTVLAWSITCRGILLRPQGAVPFFGRLGKIIAGLTPQLLLTGTPPIPWTNPMLDLPADQSLLATVWEGTQDPPFPSVADTTGVGNVISANSQLPQPLEIDPSRDVSFGVWLTPSIAQNTQIVLQSINYSVTYDDGR